MTNWLLMTTNKISPHGINDRGEEWGQKQNENVTYLLILSVNVKTENIFIQN